MLRHERDGCVWKPWLQKAYGRNSSSSNSYKDLSPRDKSKVLVLFVRIAQDDKSEMFTLRDLHDGIRIFEVKCHLELHSGIPNNFMEMCSIHNTTFEDKMTLILGNNVSFGETVRVRLNESWNELIDAVWKSSIPNLKRYLREIRKKRSSNSSSSREHLHAAPTDLDVEGVLSQALFTACRYRDTKISRLLLKLGADATYTTAMGNTCLHVASHAGHLPVVELLVTHGSSVRCRNVLGASPLDTAATRGHFDCARWLWMNQWSASLPTERLSENVTVKIDQPLKEVKNGYFAKRTETSRPITANVKPTSWSTHAENRRPKTAVYTRQLETLDSTLPPRSSLPQPASRDTLKRGPGLRRIITLNGLQSNKTKTILAYFASKKEHQKSIPGKGVTFEANIKNTSAAWSSSKHSQQSDASQETAASSLERDEELEQQHDETSLTKLWDRKQSMNVNVSKTTEKSPSILTGRHDTARTTQFCQSTNESSAHRSSWESKQTSVNVTSSLPKPTLLPFKDVTVTPPKITHSPENEGKKSPIGMHSKNATIHLTIPKAEPESISDCESINSETDGEDHTANIAQAVASVKYYKDFKIKEVRQRTDPRYVLTAAQSKIGNAAEATNNVLSLQRGYRSPSLDENTKDSLSNTEKQQPKFSDAVSQNKQAVFPLRRTLADVVLESRRSLSSANDSSQKPTRDESESKLVSNQRIVIPKHIAQQPKSSPKLDRRATGLALNHSTTTTRSAPGSVHSNSVEDETLRIEKNRKAFDTWLSKKRKAAERRKEGENKQKIQHIRRVSSRLTFEEWLRGKKVEEADDNSTTNRQEATGKNRKRNIRHHKTYEDWVKEKEEERQNKLDLQRTIDEETQLKTQQEIEKKNQEYEKKRTEWLRKKDEMRKFELEQKREKEIMIKEIASMEQQEKLKNPKVKTFEEWANAKEEISKLKQELSKVESDTLALKEKEAEKKRKKLAKEKFKLWVKKKDQKKLEEAERELAQARKRTMFLKADEPLSQSTPLNSNSYDVSEDSHYSDEELDIVNHNTLEDDDSVTSDTEEGSFFQISVQITRKSIDA